MDANGSVWLYCERATNTGFLAEPINMISSAFLILTALAGLWIYRRLPYSRKSADHRLLIGLAFLVGAGSIAFHLLASQWSELFHMIPLILFFMVYLAIALNSFLDVPAGWVALITVLYLTLTIAGLTMSCSFLDSAMQPSWLGSARQTGGATSCLNGASGYFPTLIALAVLGAILRKSSHKAASALMMATAVFFLVLVFLAVDSVYCTTVSLMGHATGTHFISHILLAVVLFILLRSAMIHQAVAPVQEIIPPDPRAAGKRSTNS